MSMVLARVFRAAIWLSAALLIGAVLYLSVRRPNPSDFEQFYFAGKLAARGQIAQLYHAQAYDPLLAELRSQGENILYIYAYRFNRPAFYAFLCIPFSWFSYHTAAKLALLINLVLFGVIVWKMPRWFPFKDFFGVDLFRPCLLLFKPFVVAIGKGQDSLLLTLLVAGSFHLAAGGAEVLAGVVLGLAAFKPHLIWVIPLALLAARKRKMLCSFLATTAALAAVSAMAVGTTGIQEWVALLRGPATNNDVDKMANVWALALRWGPAAGFAAALLTVVCLAVVLRRGSFADQFAAAILAALLLNPHTYLWDLSLLAVVAVLAVRPAARYLLVLPWFHFAPHPDVQLPWALLSLAYLAGLALKPEIEKLWRDRYERHAPICTGT